MKGKPDGRGVVTWDEGGSYAGDWCRGVRHGLGKECTPSGYTYLGGFRDNRWHGKAIGLTADGKVLFEGIWADGCVREMQLLGEEA